MIFLSVFDRFVSDHLGSITIIDMSSHRWLLPLKWVATGNSLLLMEDRWLLSRLLFPFLCSNIPLSLAYGVYISQMIRYAIACFAYEDFSKRGKLLTKKLMLHGCNESRLKSSFRKFCGRYNDLVCDYKLSLAYKLNDLFHTLC
jgi:hypothetical protein